MHWIEIIAFLYILGAVHIDNSTFKHRVNVKEGNDVVLTCNALGKPPFVWRWQLPVSIFLRLSNSKKLKQIRRGNNGQLIITSAKKAFQGKYKCTVYNAGGKASSYVDLKVGKLYIQRTFSSSIMLLHYSRFRKEL